MDLDNTNTPFAEEKFEETVVHYPLPSKYKEANSTITSGAMSNNEYHLHSQEHPYSYLSKISDQSIFSCDGAMYLIL